MRKSLLVVGLVGVLAGGVATFAAGRWAKPAGAAVAAPGAAAPDAAEARAVADAFVAKLREMKYDEFLSDLKAGMVFLTDREFADFRSSFEVYRTVVHKVYGTPTGEVALVRETAPTPDLARFVYLQKFPKGAIVWSFVLYRTGDGWRPNSVVWTKDLLAAFPAGA